MSTTQGLRIHRKERKISCVLHQSHNHTIISSEGDWKLEKTIELLNYGGLRHCLCTPCGWPDDGSFPIQTVCFLESAAHKQHS